MGLDYSDIGYRNIRVPFLDLFVKRNSDNTGGHTVFRKKTHTGRYLNGNSIHHLS